MKTWTKILYLYHTDTQHVLNTFFIYFYHYRIIDMLWNEIEYDLDVFYLSLDQISKKGPSISGFLICQKTLNNYTVNYNAAIWGIYWDYRVSSVHIQMSRVWNIRFFKAHYICYLQEGFSEKKIVLCFTAGHCHMLN